MPKGEVTRSEKANDAFQQERSRLRSRGSWDESNPREWADVANEAREQGKEVHPCLMFGFLVEQVQTCPSEILEGNLKEE